MCAHAYIQTHTQTCGQLIKTDVSVGRRLLLLVDEFVTYSVDGEAMKKKSAVDWKV